MSDVEASVEKFPDYNQTYTNENGEALMMPEYFQLFRDVSIETKEPFPFIGEMQKISKNMPKRGVIIFL